MSMLSASDVDSLGRLDATAQAALVRSGEVTAEELVTAAVTRIEAGNPALNAVVTRTYERALDQVRAGLPDGPFTGVPFLLKDLVAEQAGVRHTAGSAFLRDHVSPTDQELVVRLRRAGLVVLGKTSTAELGLLPTCEPVLFGPTRNPWDLTRSPGGSSGGSAAAVAAGMVPFAHANDAAGSIRYPASCCGLFGLKPTRGRNPLGPAYGDAWGGLAAEHAVTRSVRDSAALLDATAGPDLGDPYLAPQPPGPFAAEVGRDPGRLRIGFSGRTPPAFSGRGPQGPPVHPECAAALHDAVGLCDQLGHELVEVDLPGFTREVGAAIRTVFQAAAVATLDQWTRVMGRPPGPDEIELYTRAYCDRARRTSGGDYLLAIAELQHFARTVARFLTTVDVFLTPTLARLPPLLGELTSTADDPLRAGRRGGALAAFAGVVANVTGAPAMSVPLYWSAEGLPVGVHFLARYGDEATLFRLAAQLEAARPWANRRPPPPS
ncbi:MAG TPA: amidase [Micromonosporaceae bacterium]|nr:amidase [Micromonosporaceae bacterium]